MKNKWSAKKVKRLQLWLAARWPQLFSVRPDQVPLSLSIHKEILKHRNENPDLSCRLLNEALKRHVTSYGYLYGMQKHSHRYDLDGQQVGRVSAMHCAWAKRTLRVKQKLAQKVRKEKITNLRVTKISHVVREADCESNTSIRATSPVIRYKPSRRRFIREAGSGS